MAAQDKCAFHLDVLSAERGRLAAELATLQTESNSLLSAERAAADVLRAQLADRQAAFDRAQERSLEQIATLHQRHANLEAFVERLQKEAQALHLDNGLLKQAAAEVNEQSGSEVRHVMAALAALFPLGALPQQQSVDDFIRGFGAEHARLQRGLEAANVALSDMQSTHAKTASAFTAQQLLFEQTLLTVEDLQNKLAQLEERHTTALQRVQSQHAEELVTLQTQWQQEHAAEVHQLVEENALASAHADSWTARLAVLTDRVLQVQQDELPTTIDAMLGALESKESDAAAVFVFVVVFFSNSVS
jgi:predicted transcriptional regulator